MIVRLPMAIESRRTPNPGREADASDMVGGFELPRLFGSYHLLGKIARGGMAEVYFGLQRDAPVGEILAIKCMRANLASEARFVDMFTREGRLATLFHHPCIVRSLDVGQVDGHYYIAMRYVSGKDLTAVLRRCRQTGRRLPVPHAIHVGLSLCRALHYAHELLSPQGRPLNIVNRDVSPSNVRISYEGQVKLLDFGIAQAVMQVTSEIGILKGKFAYMSPEQIRGLPVDRRTDIFSVGIVLHEMLTCERLFREESEFVLMEKVRQTEVKPPSAFNKRVPPELDALVLRALSREPADRFQTAQELAAALEALLTRYQFNTGELGELVRSLFPVDYRKEHELLETLISAEPAVQPGRKKKRRRSRSSRGRSRRREHRERRPRADDDSGGMPAITSAAPAARNWVIYLTAGALLLAAGAMMVVALR